MGAFFMTARLTPDFLGMAKAIRLLREGDVVALPTETVYGLAACVLSEAACRKVFSVKGRPLIDPLIVHVPSVDAADALAEVSPTARRLMNAFWPGPLTLVLPKKPSVPDIVTAGAPTVALRCPAHLLFRGILTALGEPLAAPSANPFGYVSPTTADHVLDGLGGRIPAVIDGGPCHHGLESTIVSVLGEGPPRILRPGPLCAATLATSGVVVLPAVEGISEASPAAPPAPGLLSRHYSPQTTLALFSGDLLPESEPVDAWLWLVRPDSDHLSRPGSHYWLSETPDRATAARQLFALLRQLDALSPRKIHAELCPETEGLAVAINDRLRRAAAR